VVVRHYVESGVFWVQVAGGSSSGRSEVVVVASLFLHIQVGPQYNKIICLATIQVGSLLCQWAAMSAPLAVASQASTKKHCSPGPGHKPSPNLNK
jgi:hypothetical protein